MRRTRCFECSLPPHVDTPMPRSYHAVQAVTSPLCRSTPRLQTSAWPSGHCSRRPTPSQLPNAPLLSGCVRDSMEEHQANANARTRPLHLIWRPAAMPLATPAAFLVHWCCFSLVRCCAAVCCYRLYCSRLLLLCWFTRTDDQDLELVRVAASDFEGPDGTLDVTAFRDLWEGWLEPFMNALDKVHLAWAVPSPHIIHMCSRVRMHARGCQDCCWS